MLKNAPNSVIWAVALCFIGVVGAFVALSIAGADTADFRAFLNTVMNLVTVILSGGALLAAGAAAKSSANAEEQTNGSLDKRIEHGVRRAIVTPQGPGSGDQGTYVRPEVDS